MTHSVDPWARGTTLLFLVLVIGLLSLNAHDSGVMKMPVFVFGGALILTVFVAAALRTGSVTLTLSPPLLAVAGLCLLATAGWVRTRTDHGSAGGLLFLLACAAFFASGFRLFRSRRHLDLLESVVTWTSAAVVLVGIVQYFFTDTLAVEFYLGPDKRVGSLLGNPSFLAGYIVLAAPLVAARSFGTRQGTRRIPPFAVLTGLLLLLFLTESRGGMAGAVAAAGCFLLLARRPHRGWIALVVAFALLSLLLLTLLLDPGLIDRLTAAFGTGPSSTFARRVYFWKAGLAAFAASPLFGHGPGSFERVMGRFRDPDYWTVKSEDIVPHAHNEFLETMVDGGAAALVCLAVVLGWSLVNGVRAARGGDRWLHMPAAALTAGIAGLLADNLTGVSMRQAPVAALAWLCLGILSSPVFSFRAAREFRFAVPRLRPLWPLAGLALLLFAVWFIPRSAREVRASAAVMRGILASGRGDRQGAISGYREAKRLNPDLTLARSSLAAEYIQAGRPGDAFDEATELQRLYPDYPRTWLVRGIGSWMTGDFNGAFTAIGKEKLLRTHPEVWYVEALVARQTGDTLREERALEGMLRSCMKGGVNDHMAYALDRLPRITGPGGRADSLRGLLRDLAAVFPEDSAVVRARHMLQ